MKKLTSSFRKFLLEASEDTTLYDENLYEVVVELTVSKSRGGDKNQTFSELRSVDNITIVKQVPHTATEDSDYYYADVILRFIPMGGETPVSSMGVLLHQARQISGVEKLELKTAATKISNKH